MSICLCYVTAVQLNIIVDMFKANREQADFILLKLFYILVIQVRAIVVVIMVLFYFILLYFYFLANRILLKLCKHEFCLLYKVVLIRQVLYFIYVYLF